MSTRAHIFTLVRRFTLVIVCVLSLLNVEAEASPPQAGTKISARATITFFNTGLKKEEKVYSNRVVTQIKEVINLTVDYDQEITAMPGSTRQFYFSVTNNGNSVQSVRLAGVPVSDSVFPVTLQAVEVYEDIHGNGVIAAGQQPMQDKDADGHLDQMQDFPIGFQQRYIVRFAMPASAAGGTRGAIDFSATPPSGMVAKARGVALTSLHQFTLRKEVDRTSAQPNETLNYQVQLRNNGIQSQSRFNVSVDGSARRGFLVRDVVPAQTTLLALSATQTTTPLYHVLGKSEHEYQSTPPTDLQQVDAVGMLLTSVFDVGEAADFSFSVLVNKSASNTNIENTASVYRQSGADPIVQVSNRVITKIVNGSAGTLNWFATDKFKLPIKSLSVSPDDAFAYLQAVAGQCNSTSAIDEVIATITTESGDQEQVRMRETGPRTGTFHITAVKVNDDIVNMTEPRMLVAHATAIQGSGILETQMDDTITASLLCGNTSLNTELLVDPRGTVF